MRDNENTAASDGGTGPETGTALTAPGGGNPETAGTAAPDRPGSKLVARLQADFEQFEDVHMPGRNNGAHPDWIACNRLWRLFDTVARHVEEAAVPAEPVLHAASSARRWEIRGAYVAGPPLSADDTDAGIGAAVRRAADASPVCEALVMLALTQ